MYTRKDVLELNNKAREIFDKDGFHSPVVILFRGDAKLVLPVSEIYKDKESFKRIPDDIRQAIKLLNARSVAIIFESWMYEGKGENDSITKELIEGKKTVKEIDEKVDILMVRAESDDGLNVTFINPVKRDKEGKKYLDDVKEISNLTGAKTLVGNFVNLF